MLVEDHQSSLFFLEEWNVVNNCKILNLETKTTKIKKTSKSGLRKIIVTESF